MSTKSTKAVYWTATILIFLMEGVMPALTGNTDMAKEGIRHLGYPDYFRVMLNIFKVAGSLALLLPFVPARIKEWAYAGCAINFISAAVSLTFVDGIGPEIAMPLFFLGLLVASYVSYHKLRNTPVESSSPFAEGSSLVPGLQQ
jgi:hypothetical protein